LYTRVVVLRELPPRCTHHTGITRLDYQDIGTTQRYMHLSPAALDAAIRLLETPVENGTHARGEIVEAQGTRGEAPRRY